WPAVSPGTGDRVSFICSDDPTPLGTPGNRVYAYDLTQGKLFFVSFATDVQGPIAMNMGPWFVTMSTGFDLTGQGTCGRQLFLVDYFTGPQDGNTKIGVRHFVTVPGDSVAGSEGRLVTTSRTLVGDITDRGVIDMRFESPDLTPCGTNDKNCTHGETLVTIPQGYARIPPIPFLGIGAICIAQSGEGEGVLDCDGGKNGGSVSVRQDHYTDDNDPRCLTDGACREDDLTCHNSVLPGPHKVTCPRCTFVPDIGPRCSSGIFFNQVCDNNDDCRIVPCPDENANFGMCNGPMIQDLKDPYGGGGAVLNLPVSVKFSLEVGRDNLFCTDDDLYDPYFGARTEEPLLRLTTGTSFGAIEEANGVPYGPELSTAAVGGPIDCTKLRAGDLTGAKLVASLPLLDMRFPDRPGITDAVFSLHLHAQPH